MKAGDGDIPDDVLRRREQWRVRKRRERGLLARKERIEKVKLREDEICVRLPVSLIDDLIREGLKESDADNRTKIARKIAALFTSRVT